MATISDNILSASLPQPVTRLFTAADLAVMPAEFPSGPVDFELYLGRLIPMSPTGRRHGNLQSRIAKALVLQGEDNGHGSAHTEVGVLISRNPDTVVGPDASFVTARQQPIRESPEGYLVTVPELVVEIRSKNDTAAYLDRKVTDYLKAGVKVAWIVDPDANTVVEHRSGVSPKTFSTSDTLACDDIIPGFRLTLAELFKE
jgi:Uma2 family endonuclease